MSRIRIKNFGPIKDGFQENDGWIDICKVTIFIGNQGSGKSTIAKVVSTMSWIEKALVRGDFEMPQSLKEISEFFDYQNLRNYFQPHTLIEYEGNAFNIAFRKDKSEHSLTTKNDRKNHKQPKIMYVPAERNFLSVIKNAFDVKGLPQPLFTFAEELKRAQFELYTNSLDLPIDNYKYQHDFVSDTSFIIGKGFRLRLSEASSGFQSIIPMYLVSKNLAEWINSSKTLGYDNMSVSQKIRMDNEIANIIREISLSNTEKIDKAEEVENRYQNKAFINIVEEPEQNLFPSSQWKVLQSLLEFNNMNADNKLIITTHSPYIVNFISIAIQGGYLRDKIIEEKGDKELLDKLNKVVSEKALISAKNVVVYQLDENDGSVKRLSSAEGIPTDKNYLNDFLKEGNQLFDSLLEIEEEI